MSYIDNKFWEEFFNSGDKLELEIADYQKIDKDIVKIVREKLNFSQKVFADILGVSKKTIEKWEQGKNPVQGPSSRLIYLIDNDPSLVNKLYKSNLVIKSNSLPSFEIKDFLITLTPFETDLSNDVGELSTMRNEAQKCNNKLLFC